MKVCLKMKQVNTVTVSHGSIPDAIYRAMNGFGIVVGTGGHFYSRHYDPGNKYRENRYVYVVDTHDAKWRQERYQRGPKNGQHKKSVKIRDKRIQVRVFEIPKSWPVLVYQKNRHFVLEHA